MDYKQKIIANDEKNRETMKGAYAEGNKRLEEKTNAPEVVGDIDSPVENKVEDPAEKPENLFAKRMREIKEELGKEFEEKK